MGQSTQALAGTQSSRKFHPDAGSYNADNSLGVLTSSEENSEFSDNAIEESQEIVNRVHQRGRRSPVRGNGSVQVGGWSDISIASPEPENRAVPTQFQNLGPQEERQWGSFKVVRVANEGN
ncbi:MAG: hypothetical protein C5B47_02325, partial [Verrucomicrobia bacterium]